jgi:hypothetical protein
LGSPTQTLAIDTIAEVVTSDLVVRTRPGVDPPSEMLPGLLLPGDRLWVIDGPVHATFYDWYHVQPLPAGPNAGLDAWALASWPIGGWVAAASRDGEPWVAHGEDACPDDLELEVEELAALQPLEALSCFGDRGVRVRAPSAICPGIVQDNPRPPNYTVEPEWLGTGNGCALNSATAGTVYGAATQYWTPEFQVVGGPIESWLWAIGQFDHPDASSCVLRPQAGDPSLPPTPNLDAAQVVLLCRSHFAVSAFERADPP